MRKQVDKKGEEDGAYEVEAPRCGNGYVTCFWFDYLI